MVERRGAPERGAWVGVALSLSLLACASAKEEPRRPEPRAETHLSRRALIELVPPIPLSWALRARPQAMLTAPALAPLRDAWVGSNRRKTFRYVTGVDLERVPEVWILSYELGTLYLLPRTGAESAESVFTHRSQSVIQGKTGHSSLRSYGRSQGDEFQSLLVGPSFVAFVDEDPALGRLIAAKALGKLDHLPPSPERSELDAMNTEGAEVLASLYWPGPLLRSDGSPSPTSSFIATLLSIHADMRIQGTRLEVRIKLTGAWGNEEAALQGARDWLAVALSRPEIRAFDVEFTEEQPAACMTEDELNVCQLLVSFDPEAVNEGLVRVLASDLSAF